MGVKVYWFCKVPPSRNPPIRFGLNGSVLCRRTDVYLRERLCSSRTIRHEFVFAKCPSIIVIMLDSKAEINTELSYLRLPTEKEKNGYVGVIHETLSCTTAHTHFRNIN